MNIIDAMRAIQNHTGKRLRVLNQMLSLQENKKHGSINSFDVYRAEGVNPGYPALPFRGCQAISCSILFWSPGVAAFARYPLLG